MKNTLIIYITMGVLFIVPLILFNLRKIWVRKPPAGVNFYPVRIAFVVIASVLSVVFLVSAYQATLKNRYEIATERLAEKQAQVIIGTVSDTDFRNFVLENGTENVAKSFDETDFPDYGPLKSVRLQLSNSCTPKYWKDVLGFDQTEVISDGNPIYVMYVLEAGDRLDYYVARLVKTDSGWKYDWFGNASDVQIKKIEMPTAKNGKWYTVNK